MWCSLKATSSLTFRSEIDSEGKEKQASEREIDCGSTGALAFKDVGDFRPRSLVYRVSKLDLRWLERVLVFFDALYLGVKIVRLELANHDQILLQNNDNIKVSIFGRFLKKFVAMATQLGFEV